MVRKWKAYSKTMYPSRDLISSAISIYLYIYISIYLYIYISIYLLNVPWSPQSVTEGEREARKILQMAPKMVPKSTPKSTQNRPKIDQKSTQSRPSIRAGAQRGSRARFRSFSGAKTASSGPSKKPWAPSGSPKRPPGTLRTPLLGAGREHAGNHPDTPKAKGAPGHLWTRFESICLRFGSLQGGLWEPFWRHFRTSVKKARPS